MGTWEWDLERDVMTWAKGAEGILGLPEGRPLAAKRSDYLALVHPEDRRTPLFSITASLDAFEAEVGPGQSETVSLLRSQAARLTHLMRDLAEPAGVEAAGAGNH